MRGPTVGNITVSGGIAVKILSIGNRHRITQSGEHHTHPVAHITAAAVGTHVCLIGSVVCQSRKGVGGSCNGVHRCAGGIRHIRGRAAEIEVPGGLVAAGRPRHRGRCGRHVGDDRVHDIKTRKHIHDHVIHINTIGTARVAVLQRHIPATASIVCQ